MRSALFKRKILPIALIIFSVAAVSYFSLPVVKTFLIATRLYVENVDPKSEAGETYDVLRKTSDKFVEVRPALKEHYIDDRTLTELAESIRRNHPIRENEYTIAYADYRRKAAQTLISKGE